MARTDHPARRHARSPRRSPPMRVLVVGDTPPIREHDRRRPARPRNRRRRRYDGLDAATRLASTATLWSPSTATFPGHRGDALCQIIAASARPAMALMLMLTAADAPRRTGCWPSRLAPTITLARRSTLELILRVRALAPRKPAAHSCTLRAAGIELDTITRTVMRDGRQIELSARGSAIAAARDRAYAGSA